MHADRQIDPQHEHITTHLEHRGVVAAVFNHGLQHFLGLNNSMSDTETSLCNHLPMLT
jgi:hypothetical protein